MAEILSTTANPGQNAAGYIVIAENSTDWISQANQQANWTLVAAALSNSLRVYADTTGLTFGIYPGKYMTANGTVVSYAGSIGNTLSANATTNIWLDNTGVVHKGIYTGTDIVRLATIVSGSSTRTSITDDRCVWNSSSGGGTSGYSGFSGYSGTAGATGTSGFSGKSGYSGYSGVGLSGFSGYSGAQANNYTSTFIVGNWVDAGSTYTLTFAHNFNQTEIITEVWNETSTPTLVLLDTQRTDANTVVISVPKTPDSRFAGRININRGSGSAGTSGYSGFSGPSASATFMKLLSDTSQPSNNINSGAETEFYALTISNDKIVNVGDTILFEYNGTYYSQSQTVNFYLNLYDNYGTFPPGHVIEFPAIVSTGSGANGSWKIAGKMITVSTFGSATTYAMIAELQWADGVYESSYSTVTYTYVKNATPNTYIYHDIILSMSVADDSGSGYEYGIMAIVTKI